MGSTLSKDHAKIALTTITIYIVISGQAQATKVTAISIPQNGLADARPLRRAITPSGNSKIDPSYEKQTINCCCAKHCVKLSFERSRTLYFTTHIRLPKKPSSSKTTNGHHRD